MDKNTKKKIVKDILLIILSLIVAYFVMISSVVDRITLMPGELYLITTLFAGVFFTSIFTTAPAVAILAKLAVVHNPFIIAIVAGVGAMFGDFIILRFLKDHLSANIISFFDKRNKGEGKITQVFKNRFFRWSLAFIGALIIASPFPDELGLALMGLSDIDPRKFAAISFSFNAFGILVIALIARAAVS